jgi:hypothetical protein
MDLQIFEAVTKTLQCSTLTLSSVRHVFDHVLHTYPQMSGLLAPDTPIVTCPALETGLVKLRRHEKLTVAKCAAEARFKLLENAPTPNAAPTTQRLCSQLLYRVITRSQHIQSWRL